MTAVSPKPALRRTPKSRATPSRRRPAAAQLPARAARHDGWTPDRQRAFLQSLAEGHTVEAACGHVGLTPQSAYAFRQRAGGEAFALGWRAACLLARDKLADVLMSRAFEGQVDTLTRADGETVTRHRFDNRLALAMLTRLDKQAEHPALDHLTACDVTDPQVAARAAAADFSHYLGLVEGEGDAETVREFVIASETRRNPQLPQLNPYSGASWNASDEEEDEEYDDEEEEEDEADAAEEGAGAAIPPVARPLAAMSDEALLERYHSHPLHPLHGRPEPALELQPEPDAPPPEEEPIPVWRDPAGAYRQYEARYGRGAIWWCTRLDHWRTTLGHPAGFDLGNGYHPGNRHYDRCLDPAEEAIMNRHDIGESIAEIVRLREND